MYLLNSHVPAPYELNSPMGPSMAAPMARGGRAKHRKMVIAHFNPKELNVMDHLQGHQERCPKTGLRSYSHLEELFKNPHIVSNVHKHTRAQQHAYGGPALQHLAAGGRRGDSEIALIGPHTHHLFDNLAAHRTRNPYTGHPEYFSLGNMLGGAWNAVKGVAKDALAPIGGAVGEALGGPAGSVLGELGGNMISNVFGGGGKSQENASQTPVNPNLQALGQGAQQMYQAYKSGQSPTQMLGQGLQSLGGRFGNSGMGSALQNVGNAFSQGQGLKGALSQGFGQGLQQLGSRFGGGGMGSALQGMGNAFGQGQGLRGALSQGLNQGLGAFGGQGGYGNPGGMQGAPMNQPYTPYQEAYGPQEETYPMYE